jgi:predicted dehydrogenase
MTDEQIIRFGILGASSIARSKALPALAAASNARAELLGTRDPDGRRSVAEAFGVRRGTASLEDVIADGSVDAIYVSLPNSLHHTWILKALEAGKAVLSDKPMVLSLDQAEAVAAASRRAGRPVMEGFMYRFHPQHRHIRERIAGGALGEVREVSADFRFRMIEAVDPRDIRLTDGPGAGALADMGCYVVSAARLYLDDEPVAAVGWRVWRPDLGIDVGGVADLLFPGARRAQLSWGWDTGNGSKVEVFGSKATWRTDDPFVPGQDEADQTAVYGRRADGQTWRESFAGVDQFRLEFEEFAAALIEQRDPAWTVADAVAQARAMDLIRALPTVEG